MKARRFCGLLLVLALLVPAGCGTGVPTWQEQYDLGMKYLTEGNYEEAIVAFTAAIELDPKRPEAYLALSELYHLLGEEEKAIEILERAKQYVEDVTLIQSKLEELAPSCEPLTLDITSVQYEEDRLGDMEGTPTTITVRYNCPEDGDYRISLALLKGSDWITTLGTEWSPEDHKNHDPAVSGVGEISIQTRLLLFDDNGSEERLQIRGQLLTKNDSEFYTSIYEDIYELADSFEGIALPALPEYEDISADTVHTKAENVVITGTPMRFDDAFQGYRECVAQYAYYLDAETRGRAEVIRLDEPMEFPDGTVGQYMGLSYDLSFSQSNPDFFEQYCGTSVTLRGSVDVRDGEIRGMTLLTSEGGKDVLFVLPYDFAVEAITS